MTDYVLVGLTKRRAELAGKIEAAHDDLRKMLADLESLDATIIQFDPDFKVETIRPKAFRPPKDYGQPGPDEPGSAEHSQAGCGAHEHAGYCSGAFD